MSPDSEAYFKLLPVINEKGERLPMDPAPQLVAILTGANSRRIVYPHELTVMIVTVYHTDGSRIDDGEALRLARVYLDQQPWFVKYFGDSVPRFTDQPDTVH